MSSGGIEGTWRGPPAWSLALLVLTAVLASCTNREYAAETTLIGSFRPPAGFTKVDEYEAGNGGGSPVALYFGPADRVVRNMDLDVPDGYTGGAVPGPEIRTQDHGWSFRSLGVYTGPSPTEGFSECSLSFSVADEPNIRTVLSVGALCYR